MSTEQEYLILCPYCLSPISKDTVLCPACQRDTTQDAPLEMRPAEYASSTRKICRYCQASLLQLAVWCPKCGKRQ